MSKEETKEQQESFINPIDEDKIAENPHLLPYAHTVGGAVIKPEDKGRLKGRAVMAMYEQTDLQMEQIKQQIELLATQAKQLQDRVLISEEIYSADINFEPIISRTYYLYRRSSGKSLLSMVSPAEWGAKPPYTYVATVRLLGDHTWDILAKAED